MHARRRGRDTVAVRWRGVRPRDAVIPDVVTITGNLLCFVL